MIERYCGIATDKEPDRQLKPETTGALRHRESRHDTPLYPNRFLAVNGLTILGESRLDAIVAAAGLCQQKLRV